MGTPPFISSIAYSVNTVNSFTGIYIPYLNYTGYLCGDLSVFIIHQQVGKVNAISTVNRKTAPFKEFPIRFKKGGVFLLLKKHIMFL